MARVGGMPPAAGVRREKMREPMDTKEMMEALEADGAMLRAMTGKDHGPWVLLPEGDTPDFNCCLGCAVPLDEGEEGFCGYCRSIA